MKSGSGDSTRKVASFWDATHAAATHDAFLEHPMVHAYMSLRGFGRVAAHLDVAVDEVRRRTRPGARVLSVGCGPAEKEMAVAAALPDRDIVGLDIAERTMERAREEAGRRGLGNLHIEYGNFNRLELEPASYDGILGLGAVHHVEALEDFWEACWRALRPGGFVLVQEYVGPNRFQWTEAQYEIGNRLVRSLPAEHRGEHDTVRSFPLAELIEMDPSEAVRSADIVPTARASRLRIESYASGGCGILYPVLFDRMQTFDPRDWRHNHTLLWLCREDDRALRAGLVQDAMAMFVAVKEAAAA